MHMDEFLHKFKKLNKYLYTVFNENKKHMDIYWENKFKIEFVK